jgi:acetyl-CoA carboxylase carboxyl transferase subunit alpha
MGIIDEVIPEPLGGAHTDSERMGQTLKETIKKNLQELNALKKEELLKLRYKKFRGMGAIG